MAALKPPASVTYFGFILGLLVLPSQCTSLMCIDLEVTMYVLINYLSSNLDIWYFVYVNDIIALRLKFYNTDRHSTVELLIVWQFSVWSMVIHQKQHFSQITAKDIKLTCYAYQRVVSTCYDIVKIYFCICSSSKIKKLWALPCISWMSIK